MEKPFKQLSIPKGWGNSINRIEAVDFLKELCDTFGESLTIQAAWLNSLPTNKDQLPQYSLSLSAEFNDADMKTLKQLLQKNKLEIKNENGFWLIYGH